MGDTWTKVIICAALAADGTSMFVAVSTRIDDKLEKRRATTLAPLTTVDKAQVAAERLANRAPSSHASIQKEPDLLHSHVEHADYLLRGGLVTAWNLVALVVLLAKEMSDTKGKWVECLSLTMLAVPVITATLQHSCTVAPNTNSTHGLPACGKLATCITTRISLLDTLAWPWWASVAAVALVTAALGVNRDVPKEWNDVIAAGTMVIYTAIALVSCVIMGIHQWGPPGSKPVEGRPAVAYTKICCCRIRVVSHMHVVVTGLLLVATVLMAAGLISMSVIVADSELSDDVVTVGVVCAVVSSILRSIGYQLSRLYLQSRTTHV